MSCDWDVRCIDCNECAGIDNANHEEGLMRVLIARSNSLADLATIENDEGIYLLELRINSYYVDLGFFAKHRGHHLRPVDEYGLFDTPCPATFHCAVCNTDFKCEEREHDSKFNHGHMTPDHMWHSESSRSPT